MVSIIRLAVVGGVSAVTVLLGSVQAAQLGDIPKGYTAHIDIPEIARAGGATNKFMPGLTDSEGVLFDDLGLSTVIDYVDLPTRLPPPSDEGNAVAFPPIVAPGIDFSPTAPVAPVSTVPTPASGLLLLAAAAGLSGRRRRG